MRAAGGDQDACGAVYHVDSPPSDPVTIERLMMRPFLLEQIIQKTIEEYIVLMADRIEECEAKLLSLEGTTTPAAEAGAAPMVTEPEPTATSGGDPAAYPLGDELGDISQTIMAGSRYFLEVHQ